MQLVLTHFLVSYILLPYVLLLSTCTTFCCLALYWYVLTCVLFMTVKGKYNLSSAKYLSIFKTIIEFCLLSNTRMNGVTYCSERFLKIYLTINQLIVCTCCVYILLVLSIPFSKGHYDVLLYAYCWFLFWFCQRKFDWILMAYKNLKNKLYHGAHASMCSIIFGVNFDFVATIIKFWLINDNADVHSTFYGILGPLYKIWHGLRWF